MTDWPEYYRSLGTPLISEIAQRLGNGRHVAVIGPPRGGKSLLLDEVSRKVDSTSTREKCPRIVRIAHGSFRRYGPSEFCAALARDLGLSSSRYQASDDIRLAGAIVALFQQSLEERGPQLWVFVQNILGLPTPIARELLAAFQYCNEASELRGRLGVIVTGGSDFVDLTASPVSPYRHAEKILITGMEPEFARSFLLRYLRQHLGGSSHAAAPEDLDEHFELDAFDHLFREAGGMPHLMMQAMLCGESVLERPGSVAAQRPWSLQEIKARIAFWIEELMQEDETCRSVLREAEASQSVFDLLCDILRSPDPTYRLGSFEPHILETTGLVRRSGSGLGSISCPIWRRFLESEFTPRYLADVHASHRNWPHAWAAYEALSPDQRDRPVSGHARYRLTTVVSNWEDSLIESAQQGCSAVCGQFFRGANHCLGFDEGALFARDGESIQPLHDGLHYDHAVKHLNARRGALMARRDDDGVEYWLNATRLRLWSDSKRGLRSVRGAVPSLYLARYGYGREIDTTDQRTLLRVVRRFWDALYLADEAEYREGFRERHLRVIQSISKQLLDKPFDLAAVIRGAAEALVNDALHSRVLISLLDAKCQRIQGVTSACAPQMPEGNYLVDFAIPGPDSLLTAEELADLDIHPWVVHTRTTCSLLDASLETQRNPRTQWQHASTIGMHALTVVPMVVNSSVVGTIQLESHDPRVFSESECNLLLSFADQIGALFQQAQRLTLLYSALCHLRDEVRIVDPMGRLLFLNPTAAAKEHISELGWQSTQKTGAAVTLSAEPTHVLRIEHTSDGAVHAYHELTEPIDDFRAQLPQPFAADGRIGYVQQVHDLSDLHALHETVLYWLSAEDLRETTQRIMRTFKALHYSWGRLYLLKGEEPCSQYLQGVDGFGVADDAVQETFQSGALRHERDATSTQPWHVIEVAKQPAIYQLDTKLQQGTVIQSFTMSGYHCYSTGEVLRVDPQSCPPERWIEAPLYVGTNAIGKIVLSFPEEDLSPGRWELLQTTIVGAAVALDRSIRTEDLRRQIRTHAALEDVMRHLVEREQSLKDALKGISDGIRAILGPDVTAIAATFDEESGRLAERHISGPLAPGLASSLLERCAREVVVVHSPVFVSELRQTELSDRWVGPELQSGHVRSFAAIPMLSHGRTVGVIVVLSSQVLRFDEDTRQSLNILASHAEVAIEMAELHETAFHASLVKAADLGYLASGIAHEFLNSLQNMRLLVESLSREVDSSASGGVVDALLSEYDRAVQMIDGFKSLRDRPISEQSFDLDELVNSIVAISHRRALDHGVDLRCSVEGVRDVRADASLIQSIIVNLVRNALDAVEDASGKRSVEIEVRPTEPQSVEIRVRDSGPGIPPSIADRLFLPYYTTKGPKSMGVGLFWVQRIVRRLNGRISVEVKNEMGGATFCVVLPIAIEPISI